MKKERAIKGLVIDDDPEDTMLLMQLLAKGDWPSFHFMFECAETLEDGLKILAEGATEVVLLDLMLPDSQGIETVRLAHARFPEIPIVVLTGLRDEAMGLEAVAQGAQDYQVKGSIDGHALKRTISYAVERHRMQLRMKTLIDKAADAMVVVDAKGLARYLNPAAEALLGCKAADLLGRPFPYAVSPDRAGELKIGERLAEMRISEIDWQDEPAMLASIRDITDLRRVEQLKAEIKERQRMDKLKDELMSAVSHEMKSPLTIIKAATSNLEEGLAGPLTQDQASLVKMQTKNVARLNKIIDNILDLSRLESGKAQITPENIDAAQLIRETLSGYRLVASERDIIIEQELPERLPVYADPELLIQVVSNLIDNALRFTKTRILIRAQAAPDHRAQISVSDDGAGIPASRIGELFNKFVQVSRKGEGYKGTGLGLAICKDIVERQQGRIWVESVEGRGAQFHFQLPQYGETYAEKK
jgi:signal transduction histidine kinase